VWPSEALDLIVDKSDIAGWYPAKAWLPQPYAVSPWDALERIVDKSDIASYLASHSSCFAVVGIA